MKENKLDFLNWVDKKKAKKEAEILFKEIEKQVIEKFGNEAEKYQIDASYFPGKQPLINIQVIEKKSSDILCSLTLKGQENEIVWNSILSPIPTSEPYNNPEAVAAKLHLTSLMSVPTKRAIKDRLDNKIPTIVFEGNGYKMQIIEKFSK